MNPLILALTIAILLYCGWVYFALSRQQNAATLSSANSQLPVSLATYSKLQKSQSKFSDKKSSLRRSQRVKSRLEHSEPKKRGFGFSQIKLSTPAFMLEAQSELQRKAFQDSVRHSKFAVENSKNLFRESKPPIYSNRPKNSHYSKNNILQPAEIKNYKFNNPIKSKFKSRIVESEKYDSGQNNLERSGQNKNFYYKGVLISDSQNKKSNQHASSEKLNKKNDFKSGKIEGKDSQQNKNGAKIRTEFLGKKLLSHTDSNLEIFQSPGLKNDLESRFTILY